MKKAIISAIVGVSIMLAGCSEQPEEIIIDASIYGGNAEAGAEVDLLGALQDEIIKLITQQTEIEKKDIAIMLGGNQTELSISVGFPKKLDVDRALIQTMLEQAIKNVSETTNVKMGEVILKIEEY